MLRGAAHFHWYSKNQQMLAKLPCGCVFLDNRLPVPELKLYACWWGGGGHADCVWFSQTQMNSFMTALREGFEVARPSAICLSSVFTLHQRGGGPFVHPFPVVSLSSCSGCSNMTK